MATKLSSTPPKPPPKRLRAAVVALIASAGLAPISGAAAPGAAPAPPAMAGIGRAATPAEVRAWDIDVRADFEGLPAGSGSVAQGEKVWEAKCASCHGAFGESNEVFTPIVGGTSKQDIEAGRVRALSTPGYPHRTTLMRLSQLSTLWDYIHRAMPWNAPKSLSVDEVYGTVAYILNLGEIVPADFTLSDRNIAEVGRRLPNRDGKRVDLDLWRVEGRGDVKNPACMRDCPVEGRLAAALPDSARNSHGNIAEQVRGFGATRGTDTSPAAAAPSNAAHALDLLKANACTACHGLATRLVGPAFQDVAARYAGRADAVDLLAAKIRSGGQGAWGTVPMPEQAQLKEGEARAIATWLAGGAK